MKHGGYVITANPTLCQGGMGPQVDCQIEQINSF